MQEAPFLLDEQSDFYAYNSSIYLLCILSALSQFLLPQPDCKCISVVMLNYSHSELQLSSLELIFSHMQFMLYS